MPSAAVGAQVYGASLLVMNVDTEAEADYLRELAAALGLDTGTVARLHELTGAPACEGRSGRPEALTGRSARPVEPAARDGR